MYGKRGRTWEREEKVRKGKGGKTGGGSLEESGENYLKERSGNEERRGSGRNGDGDIEGM